MKALVVWQASDKVNGLVTETSRHGRVWKSQIICMQFAVPAKRLQSSPDYGIAINSANLDVALDHSLKNCYL